MGGKIEVRDGGGGGRDKLGVGYEILFFFLRERDQVISMINPSYHTGAIGVHIPLSST